MSASISPEPSPYRRARDVRYRVVEGEAVILRQRAGETLVLNEVGARVLELLDHGATLDTVAATLAEEFEVETDEARRDVEAFAADLVSAGILESNVAATTPEGAAP